MKNRLILILVFCALFSLSSCIFVKTPKTAPLSVNLSPRPSVKMSDEFLRSQEGDLAAFIPRDWLFVDVEEEISADVLGAAVNAEYNLCAVFSKIKKNDKTEDALAKEGIIGLANVALAKHAQKTANGVKQIGAPSIIEIGQNKFAYFELSSNSGATKTMAVSFISTLNNYYEFTLSPLDVSGKPLFDDKEMKNIFNSILCSLQF